MGNINEQIDAAVVLMKAQAAEFDEKKTMDGMRAADLILRATNKAARARTIDDPHGRFFPESARADLIDCMNLCALALSLLPGTAP